MELIFTKISNCLLLNIGRSKRSLYVLSLTSVGNSQRPIAVRIQGDFGKSYEVNIGSNVPILFIDKD